MAFVRGEYGVSDLFLGVPVVLGANGVERILEVKLSEEEQASLMKSANAVKKVTQML